MLVGQFEYFNYKETPETAAAKKFQDLDPLTTGMHGYSLLRPVLNNDYFHDLYDSSAAFGIPIEGAIILRDQGVGLGGLAKTSSADLAPIINLPGHHTETGPGVYESALAYQPVARMADNATLFKYIAKIVGYKYGVMPTFMAYVLAPTFIVDFAS